MSVVGAAQVGGKTGSRTAQHAVLPCGVHRAPRPQPPVPEQRCGPVQPADALRMGNARPACPAAAMAWRSNGNDRRAAHTYKDRQNNDQEKVLTLEVEEFVRRFLMHVVPAGFHKIRHYGLLAAQRFSVWKSKI